jgi:hypothetical protein
MPRQFKNTDTSIWAEQFGTGKDGSITITTSPEFQVNTSPFTSNANGFGVFTGTAGNSFGTASDAYGFWTDYVFVGDYVLIHQSQSSDVLNVGKWELNVVTGGIPASGGSNTLTLKYPLQNTYTANCQIIKCPQFTDFTINSGSVLYTPSWDGTKFGITAFFVNGTATITGSINTASRGFRGGAGRDLGSASFQGESYVSTGTTSTLRNHNGGGGSDGDNGGGRGAGGGGGANGTFGSDGTTEGGSAQAGQGGGGGSSAENTIIVMGGGGGGGSRTGSGFPYPAGGNGAGIVMIFARNIVVTGAQGIIAEGSKGIANSDGMGGSGAGGSILIKAINATLGTNIVTAIGGTTTTYGGAGGVGTIHLDYAGSFTGTTTPTLTTAQDSSLYPSGGSFLFNLI